MAQLSSYDNETREDLLDVFFHDMEYPAGDHAEQDSAQAEGADDGQENDGPISSGDSEADDCDPSKNPVSITFFAVKTACSA